MDPRSEAEENLRVIRALMERATVYRAISAPTALAGGTLSLILSASAVYWLSSGGGSVIPIGAFLLGWFGALIVTLIVSTLFLWENAHRRGDALVSPAMKTAWRAAAPPLAAAAAVTVLFAGEGAAFSLSIIWITMYGLALLATSHFAPRSLVVLGWAFLITGITMMLFVHLRILTLVGYSRSDIQTALLMGATFGLYHIVYAVAVWPRRATGNEAGEQ